MFRGFYTISLDSKGRLSVPAKVRELFNKEEDKQFILTLDVEMNLLLYTLDEWEKAEAKLIKLPSINKKARTLKRRFLSHSTEVELDSTGRLLIPSSLRSKAGINKKVVFIGMGNKFEIWGEERWDEITEQDTQDLLSDDFDLGEELESLSL